MVVSTEQAAAACMGVLRRRREVRRVLLCVRCEPRFSAVSLVARLIGVVGGAGCRKPPNLGCDRHRGDQCFIYTRLEAAMWYLPVYMQPRCDSFFGSPGTTAQSSAPRAEQNQPVPHQARVQGCISRPVDRLDRRFHPRIMLYGSYTTHSAYSRGPGSFQQGSGQVAERGKKSFVVPRERASEVRRNRHFTAPVRTLSNTTNKQSIAPQTRKDHKSPCTTYPTTLCLYPIKSETTTTIAQATVRNAANLAAETGTSAYAASKI